MSDNITLPREVRLAPCKPASFGAVDAFIWPHIAAKLVREQHTKIERLRELLSRTESALDVLAQTIRDVEEIVGVELAVKAEAVTELATEVRAALRQEDV
jgi:hypothetical protein